MKQMAKYVFLMFSGGLIYVCIEMLARGFSHLSMFFVGGICFVFIGVINEITPRMPILLQMTISCIIVTAIELAAGYILNIWLGMNVWDYSDRAFNVLGQICAKNTIYWFLLSAAAIIIDDYIRYLFFYEEKPNYLNLKRK